MTRTAASSAQCASRESPPDGNCRAACEVAPGLVLDGGLCLYHRVERWLAIADLHYGYELTKRRQGGLFPLFGMDAIEERVRSAITSYQPETLILVGDIVDGHGSDLEAVRLVESIRELTPETVCIAGNHDVGRIRSLLNYVDEFETPEFRFHHGHVERLLDGERGGGKPQVTGHLHPTVSVRDGAGLVLELPALIRERTAVRGERWILPAFSPWAGGRNWKLYDLPPDTSRWVCSPKRVFPIEEP